VAEWCYPHIFSEATFEVYVRQAYYTYTLLSIDYEEGDGTDDGEAFSIVTWRFNLCQSRSPPLEPLACLYINLFCGMHLTATPQWQTLTLKHFRRPKFCTY
jgi:hypothetical protein